MTAQLRSSSRGARRARTWATLGTGAAFAAALFWFFGQEPSKSLARERVAIDRMLAQMVASGARITTAESGAESGARTLPRDLPSELLDLHERRARRVLHLVERIAQVQGSMHSRDRMFTFTDGSKDVHWTEVRWPIFSWVGRVGPGRGVRAADAPPLRIHIVASDAPSQHDAAVRTAEHALVGAAPAGRSLENEADGSAGGCVSGRLRTSRSGDLMIPEALLTAGKLTEEQLVFYLSHELTHLKVPCLTAAEHALCVCEFLFVPTSTLWLRTHLHRWLAPSWTGVAPSSARVLVPGAVSALRLANALAGAWFFALVVATAGDFHAWYTLRTNERVERICDRNAILTLQAMGLDPVDLEVEGMGDLLASIVPGRRKKLWASLGDAGRTIE